MAGAAKNPHDSTSSCRPVRAVLCMLQGTDPQLRVAHLPDLRLLRRPVLTLFKVHKNRPRRLLGTMPKFVRICSPDMANETSQDDACSCKQGVIYHWTKSRLCKQDTDGRATCRCDEESGQGGGWATRTVSSVSRNTPKRGDLDAADAVLV
jgi:hypothetical protein